MNIINKLDSYKADWKDVALIKIGVLTATLLLVKLWTPIISVRWFWYFLIFLVVVIRPIGNFFNQVRS